MVEEDCDQVEETCRAYDSFAHELNANAEYGNGLSHAALMETVPKTTKGEIFRLLAEADRCKELPKFLFIGVLRCGLSELTSRCTRQTGLCHRSLSRLLPEVFLTQAESTIERCYFFRKTLNDSLSSKTTSLEDFIEVLGVYTTAVEEHDTLEACYKRDMGTMDVLETHKLPTTDAVRAKYKGLQNMWRGYAVTTAVTTAVTAAATTSAPSGMALTPVLTYLPSTPKTGTATPKGVLRTHLKVPRRSIRTPLRRWQWISSHLLRMPTNACMRNSLRVLGAGTIRYWKPYITYLMPSRMRPSMCSLACPVELTTLTACGVAL
jgi:hypothetical protein